MFHLSSIVYGACVCGGGGGGYNRANSQIREFDIALIRPRLDFTTPAALIVVTMGTVRQMNQPHMMTGSTPLSHH